MNVPTSFFYEDNDTEDVAKTKESKVENNNDNIIVAA